MTLYDDMTVAAVPLDLAYADKEKNLKQAERMISALPGRCDLAVLPELFSTAFIDDPERALAEAEENDGPTMAFIKRLAARRCMAICGSFLARDGEKLFNRAFLVEPNGDAVFYDKRHTFSLSQESKFVTSGASLPPVVRFRGWNIALIICYDLRFPVWCRNVKMRYDLLVVPANWPDKRSFAWTHLLQARAIENEAYCIGANRSGSDDFGCYNAQSFIYDFKGRQIGEEAGPNIVATISKSELEKFRDKFPAWVDADDFSINL